MKAVWLVRSRQLASRLRFWMALVGYDRRDRSLGQRIYLVYAGIFFSLWGFAVLALLADLGAGVLSLFRGIQPGTAAALIITVVLIANALLRAYSSARRSPFIFSEDDAGLICQTLVDRRYVAIVWMLSDWLTATIPFSALAVVLAFANLQLIEPGGVQWSHLPSYWLVGLRVMSIVLPIHLALTSVDYAFGALRLRGDRDYPALFTVPVGLAAFLISMALISPSVLQVLMWPIQFPVNAGINGLNWPAGFSVGLLSAIIGCLVLYWSSSGLNLGRAAQETHFRWVYQQLGWLGDPRLAHQMRARQRLGSGHVPSHLPGRPGSWSLIWKDWVIFRRSINFSQISPWMGIFCTSLGMILPLGQGVHLWAFVLWCIFVGQHGAGQLRSDMQLWTITRQLPLTVGDFIIFEIAQPVLGVTIISWLAYGMSAALGYFPQLTTFLLLPVASLGMVLAGVLDILRQCQSSDLLSGNVAEMGAGGLLLGAILGGFSLGFVPWIASRANSIWIHWLIVLIGLILACVFTMGLWRLIISRYHNIK